MTIKDLILNVIERAIENESFASIPIQDNIEFKAYYGYEQDSINLELSFYNKNTIIDNIYGDNGEFDQDDIETLIVDALAIYQDTLSDHIEEIKQALETANFTTRNFNLL